MKSLTSFLQVVLQDLGDWCCTSTTQDLKTVLRRFEHEGLSFLTITLPSFGRDFEKSLDQGFADPSLFDGFHRREGLPTFMSGFLDQVFDRASGRLLDDPSIACIRAVRQFSLMFAKISVPCTPARDKAAIDRYMECEQDVRKADANVDTERYLRFTRIGTLLWADVFARMDFSIYHGLITPKHGPGATADKLRGNAKWNQKEWTQRLEELFPHGEHLVSSWRHFHRLSDVRILEPGAERPVRVVTVPKTLKSPRIIAIEPCCMQFVQQGLLAEFDGAVRADDIARQLIGWSSQVPNQHLARQGSLNGDLATLDLSEASDRVSNQHVRGLLRNHPHLAAGVEACRSRKADVPGHGVIRLAKFASMGSALCFPFEAAVFATMVFVGIEEQLNRPITRKEIYNFLGKVRVYGDDIIVPVEFVPSVIRVLEDFGLRVNRSKSFWNGKFRESCGADFYAGEDVSVIRMRSLLPVSRRDDVYKEVGTHRQYAEEILSTVSFRNRLYSAGLWKTARFLDGILGELIPFPNVYHTLVDGVWTSNSPVVGRHSFLGYDTHEMCPNTQRPLVKGMLVSSRLPVSILEDYGALRKVLGGDNRGSSRDDPRYVSYGTRAEDSNVDWAEYLDDLPFIDPDHLTRTGRPRVVDIKHGKGPSY